MTRLTDDDAAERRRRAAATAPPGRPGPLSPAKEFRAWCDALIASSEHDDDALLLAFHIAQAVFAFKPAEGYLTQEEATDWANVLIDAAQTTKDKRVVSELAKLRRTYLDANQAMPAALHRFDPGSIKRKGPGRPRGQRSDHTVKNDPKHARRIYASRRRAGAFPDLTCDPWHLLHHLADEIERQIATDKRGTNRSITKTLEDLGHPGPLPLSAYGLKQLWNGESKRGIPSLRRRLIIEAMAWHCLAWWRDRGHTPTR